FAISRMNATSSRPCTTRNLQEVAFIREIAKLEGFLNEQPAVNSAMSYTSIYKSLNQASNGNQASAYVMPESDSKLRQYQKLARRVPEKMNVLISSDERHARVAARIFDMGADSIKRVSQEIDQWISTNMDTSALSMRQTGTGVIIDKNSEYVRDSLLKGLGFAILIVGILMALLFRNWRMVFISFIPNILPLLFAGALLGFVGIELEGGIAIVFAIIFGIAVDDTIHFLSKYKLAIGKGLSVDEAIDQTFKETGKAIALTTIVLFFGFLILLFSVHPPSISIGLLISCTLFSALFADLLFIPGLLRHFMPQASR
ncbi:MAG: MMPL family transporter, partial [Bacteroidota bacterium]